MSTRRATQFIRCPKCQISPVWCFCEFIPSLTLNNSRIDVIRHQREAKLPTNTSRYIELASAQAKLHTHGKIGEESAATLELLPDHIPVYLFPDEDSCDISDFIENNKDKKIQLIVPDGSWKQTKKFKRRIPVLNGIQSVHVNKTRENIYTLRKQSSDNGMCTLEAIAYALESLEGRDYSTPLFELLEKMNNAFLYSRNMKLWHESLNKS